MTILPFAVNFHSWETPRSDSEAFAEKAEGEAAVEAVKEVSTEAGLENWESGQSIVGLDWDISKDSTTDTVLQYW